MTRIVFKSEVLDKIGIFLKKLIFFSNDWSDGKKAIFYQFNLL